MRTASARLNRASEYAVRLPLAVALVRIARQRPAKPHIVLPEMGQHDGFACRYAAPSTPEPLNAHRFRHETAHGNNALVWSLRLKASSERATSRPVAPHVHI